jgi:hypothetical protein
MGWRRNRGVRTLLRDGSRVPLGHNFCSRCYESLIRIEQEYVKLYNNKDSPVSDTRDCLCYMPKFQDVIP